MFCADDQRRALVRAHRDKDGQPDFNGLDYVEVAEDGLTLMAYFIGKLPAVLQTNSPALNKYLRVEGGRKVRDIKVVDVDPHLEEDADADEYLVISLDKQGDFSTYTLRLIGLENIDPYYDHADFSFKIDCPSDLDCAQTDTCPPAVLEEPDMNYLAKDYASFRQLVLDRLALIMPDWTERHVPDLGITLVELLAYVGDHLSYYQDAVATEAYLDTARQRISVRRHARLVDYFLHEGCNARAWLALSILDADTFDLDLSQASFLALLDPARSATRDVLSVEEFLQLPPETCEVFEPLARTNLTLRSARNEIKFYTWGERECCLPRGATSASLLDYWQPPVQPPPVDGKPVPTKKSPIPAIEPRPERTLKLQPGDVLIFEEVIGPKTGNPADADPAHRVAVRLTSVAENEDMLVPALPQANDANSSLPTPVLDIEWQVEDALPFPLCLSATTLTPDCKYLENISIARGNIVLVDHGRTLHNEEIGAVPLKYSEAECECDGKPGEVTYHPGQFRPRVLNPGLTYSQPLPIDKPARQAWVSAKRLSQQDPRAALPQIVLSQVPAAPLETGGLAPLFKIRDIVDPGDLIKRMLDPKDAFGALLFGKLSQKNQKNLSELKEGETPLPNLLDAVSADLKAQMFTWEPRFDLLSSGPDDRNFVVEIDNESAAHLRFGNNDLGEEPQAGSAFYATYRVGNGSRGNLGAEAINHLVLNLSGATLRVRNPLPSRAGAEAEPISEARLYAPYLFRNKLERAITSDDYAKITMREYNHELQGAAASLAWTGSWYEAELAIDPLKSEARNHRLEQKIGRTINKYRRMGHDLRVETAHYVPLDIELQVCARPNYLRGDIKAALLEIFSHRLMPNGEPGYFHPDRLTFGEDILLSRIIAASQSVEGVSSVQVTRLQRLIEAPNQEIENGVLPLGPFEIAQVDNDPDYPERGRFTIVMSGGR